MQLTKLTIDTDKIIIFLNFFGLFRVFVHSLQLLVTGVCADNKDQKKAQNKQPAKNAETNNESILAKGKKVLNNVLSNKGGKTSAQNNKEPRKSDEDFERFVHSLHGFNK